MSHKDGEGEKETARKTRQQARTKREETNLGESRSIP